MFVFNCQVNPVIQINEVTPVAAVEEEEEEIGDLSSVLETLGLSEYLSIFETEKIDVESLVRAFFKNLIYFTFIIKASQHSYFSIRLCSSCARSMI